MITTAFKNLVMNNVFHTANQAAFPAKYYIGWSTTTLGAGTNGSEFTEPASNTGYVRVEFSGIANAVDGMICNNTQIAWAESLANQGITMAYGVFDSLTGGNLLIYDNIAEVDRKTIEKGTTFYAKPGELSFTLRGL